MIAIEIKNRTAYSTEDRPTILRAAKGLEARLNNLDPTEQTEFLARVESALETHTPDETRADLVTLLTGDRTYEHAEIAELEVQVLTASFARRRELLRGAITAPKVAKLLGTSRQTPHDRVNSGTLLGVQDRGAWYFPSWQFDFEGPDGVIAGLPDVLRSIHASPLGKISWLMRLNGFLDGASPLEVLKRGEIDRVISLAQSVGVA